MRFNKLDLNQLVVLDAVLSERSVKKAAERLFLSAAATSCALARLREYFEDELLQRVGKTMILTPKAESLARPVRDVLMQVQSITTTNPSFDPLTSTRKITVEASDYVISILLASVIRRAAEEAPRMQFDLRLVGLHSHADLENGDIDVLVVPEFFAAPNHPSVRLFSDTWSCVQWKDQDLPSGGLTLKRYLSLGHVVCEWGAGRMTSSDERMAKQLGYARRREVTAPNFSSVAELLIGTSRVTTLQTRLANMLALNAPLRVSPCPMPMPELIETVQWHKYHDRDPAVTWFRGLLGRAASTLDLDRPNGALEGTVTRGAQRHRASR